MSCLEAMEIGLMHSDRLFQLLDILGTTFSESGLGLTVALFPFFRGCVDLSTLMTRNLRLRTSNLSHTGFLPPFLFGCAGLSGWEGPASASASGVDSMMSSEEALMSSFLSIDMLSSIAHRQEHHLRSSIRLLLCTNLSPRQDKLVAALTADSKPYAETKEQTRDKSGFCGYGDYFDLPCPRC
jgi:hypothetical protein